MMPAGVGRQRDLEHAVHHGGCIVACGVRELALIAGILLTVCGGAVLLMVGGPILLIVGGLVSIPLFWFVPPWIASGQPFLAATHAHLYNGHLGSDRFLTVVRRGANLQVTPALVVFQMPPNGVPA